MGTKDPGRGGSRSTSLEPEREDHMGGRRSKSYSVSSRIPSPTAEEDFEFDMNRPIPGNPYPRIKHKDPQFSRKNSPHDEEDDYVKEPSAPFSEETLQETDLNGNFILAKRRSRTRMGRSQRDSGKSIDKDTAERKGSILPMNSPIDTKNKNRDGRRYVAPLPEQTPSAEGSKSEIRIVDAETGEVFYTRRSSSNLHEGGYKGSKINEQGSRGLINEYDNRRSVTKNSKHSSSRRTLKERFTASDAEDESLDGDAYDSQSDFDEDFEQVKPLRSWSKRIKDKELSPINEWINNFSTDEKKNKRGSRPPPPAPSSFLGRQTSGAVFPDPLPNLQTSSQSMVKPRTSAAIFPPLPVAAQMRESTIQTSKTKSVSSNSRLINEDEDEGLANPIENEKNEGQEDEDDGVEETVEVMKRNSVTSQMVKSHSRSHPKIRRNRSHRDDSPVKSQSDRDRTPRNESKVRSSGRRRASRMKNVDDVRLFGGRIFLPGEILKKIVSLLGPKDRLSCYQVCSQWKKLLAQFAVPPLVFSGRAPLGQANSRLYCRNFIKDAQELEQRFFVPCELLFNSATDDHVRYLIMKKRGSQFRSAIRNMVGLHLVNCTLKWTTLVEFLHIFVDLRTFTDTNSSHFSSHAICIRKKKRIAKEQHRNKMFEGFREKLGKLRRVSITRKSMDPELILLLDLLSKGARQLHHIEINLDPYYGKKVVATAAARSQHPTPTPITGTRGSGSRSAFLIPVHSDPSSSSSLATSQQNVPCGTSPIVKAFNRLLLKNTKTLTTLTVKWIDDRTQKSVDGPNYISAFLDSLEKLKLNSLTGLTLTFDTDSMAKAKGLKKLNHFLNHHCFQKLGRVSISTLPLGKAWINFLDRLNSFICLNKSMKTVFNFNLVLADTGTIYPQKWLTLFQSSLTKVHVTVAREDSASLQPFIGIEEGAQFPRVSSCDVTFDSNTTSYPNFTDLAADLIVYNYPNLTELRISDRLFHHGQIFNRVLGRSLKQGVSGAQIRDRDIQIICAELPRLKVLKLWVELTSVSDLSVTGFHPKDLMTVKSGGIPYQLEYLETPFPNFSHLRDLEVLSLRGVGPSITDISALYGFRDLFNLKLFELVGPTMWTKKVATKFERFQLNSFRKVFLIDEPGNDPCGEALPINLVPALLTFTFPWTKIQSFEM